MAWDNWELRHEHFRAALEADQVERKAIRNGLTSIESGTEDERVSGAVDDALEGDGNSWAERQEVLESRSGAVSDELNRRAEIMGASYPFAIVDGALQYTRSATGVYEFCLAAAGNPTGAARGQLKASAVFENIVRDVLSLHLGGAEGFRTGAPPYAAEGRGTTARETFRALEAACGEFRWHPREHLPAEPTYQDLKDAGLDVVVWKRWPDRRPAHLFVLGQCACGKNDVDAEKARDLSLSRLENWLRPVCYSRPMRAFATAHHIPNIGALYDIALAGVLVMDRARIVLIAESDRAFMGRAGASDYWALAELYMTPVAG